MCDKITFYIHFCDNHFDIPARSVPYLCHAKCDRRLFEFHSRRHSSSSGLINQCTIGMSYVTSCLRAHPQTIRDIRIISWSPLSHILPNIPRCCYVVEHTRLNILVIYLIGFDVAIMENDSIVFPKMFASLLPRDKCHRTIMKCYVMWALVMCVCVWLYVCYLWSLLRLMWMLPFGMRAIAFDRLEIICDMAILWVAELKRYGPFDDEDQMSLDW